MKTFWISFANDDEGNLGCCIVDAESSKEAILMASELGINPGGEAMIWEMPDDNEDATAEINKYGKNILIRPEQLLSEGYRKTNEMDDETQQYIIEHPKMTVISEEYNPNK